MELLFCADRSNSSNNNNKYYYFALSRYFTITYQKCKSRTIILLKKKKKRLHYNRQLATICMLSHSQPSLFTMNIYIYMCNYSRPEVQN